MDFQTMQKKLDALQYTTVEQFEKDFQLMIHNCTVYNAQHTMYYKAAIKLKDGAQILFKQLRKDLETVFIGSSSYSRSGDSSLPTEEVKSEPETTLSLDINNYLIEKNREGDSLEQQLSKLEDYLRQSQQLPQGPAKVKRIRLLKYEKQQTLKPINVIVTKHWKSHV